jgi:hypothetical protein
MDIIYEDDAGLWDGQSCLYIIAMILFLLLVKKKGCFDHGGLNGKLGFAVMAC